MRTRTARRLLGALAVVSALALTATACGSDASDGAGGGPKDIEAALEKGAR